MSTPIEESRRAQLRGLEDRLGYHFADLARLDQALTHTSFANEGTAERPPHNEPLEFLGDSILGFMMADLLHRQDPDGPEGVKSRTRALLKLVPNSVSAIPSLRSKHSSVSSAPLTSAIRGKSPSLRSFGRRVASAGASFS